MRLKAFISTAFALHLKAGPAHSTRRFSCPVMSVLPPEKVARLSSDDERSCLRIGTHDGQFHCDEVLACWLLRTTEKFKGAEIVRTRDPKILNLCDIVVDVGATYDPATLRLDHHQREFTGTFSPKHRTKLSSAGLVYKHFGLEILGNMLSASKEDLNKLYEVIYDNLIEEIDGVDNGVSCFPSDLTPAYRITTQLGQRVGRLNPQWNDPSPNPTAGFEKAMTLVGAEFSDTVDYYGRCWLPARTIVATALAKRSEADPSGSIMLLEGHVPWKEHLFELEEETGARVLFVLYPGEGGSWRVQCVPVREDSFESRRPLPEPLRGLRDDALSARAGIEGGIFVHATGFIGGMRTLDGALALARAAMADPA